MNKAFSLITLIVMLSHLAISQKRGFLSVDRGPKYSFQAGVSAYNHIFFANAYHDIGDTLTIRANSPYGEMRTGFVFLVNRIIRNNLNLEIGLKTNDIYYFYRLGLTHAPSGFYVEKVGAVRTVGVDIPINAELRLLRIFYVKAGLSLSLFNVKKNRYQHFNDLPQLDRTFNEMQHSFKPAVLNYGAGLGIIIWRIDLGLYLSGSKTRINDRFCVNGEPYNYLYNTLHTTNLSLTYHFRMIRNDRIGE